MSRCRLLDERSRPDVRAAYGTLARRASRLDAAVHRIRLGGMTLSEPELDPLRRIRLLMGEMNALNLSWEAEAMVADPQRVSHLRYLEALLEEGRLHVRLAPLAAWNPDFSVFHRTRPAAGQRTGEAGPTRNEGSSVPSGSAPDAIRQDGAVLLLGPHWFVRPYPHPGPAFTAIIRGAPARLAARRFEETWQRGHDVRAPLLALIRRALAAPPAPAR